MWTSKHYIENNEGVRILSSLNSLNKTMKFKIFPGKNITSTDSRNQNTLT